MGLQLSKTVIKQKKEWKWKKVLPAVTHPFVYIEHVIF